MRLFPLVILLLAFSCVAQTTGRVVAVSDGDTITVQLNKKQVKVRLAGIDAPEKGQDYANAAKEMLSYLVFSRTINLEGRKVDRYGRFVSKVLSDGKDINLEMVKLGLAWHYKKYESEQSFSDRRAYAQAETDAKKSSLNIWRYSNPVAPWDYRHENAGVAHAPLRASAVYIVSGMPNTPGVFIDPTHKKIIYTDFSDELGYRKRSHTVPRRRL